MEADNFKRPVFSLDSIVIDCPDADSLADFYARMLGWHRCPGGDEWAAISNPGGVAPYQVQAYFLGGKVE